MKTFSDEALAALQRGDAIVSASVEIIPVNGTSTATVANVSDEWLYKTESPGSAADYSSAAYDDSAWSEGQGGFSNLATSASFPDMPTANTIIFGGVSPITAESIVWIRKHLGALGAADIDLDVWHDDSAEVWFNGTSVTLTADGDLHSVGTVPASSVNTGSDNVIAVKAVDSIPTGDPTRIYAGCTATQTVTVDGDPIRLWGGYGDLDLPSDAGTSTFKGIGDRGLIQSSTGAIGGTAQNLTLALSGIEPEAIAVLNPDEVRGASVVVRRLIFDSAGKTLLGAYVYTRGRVDELKTSEVVGGAASIQLSVEGAARGLGRRGGRARSDADQRLVSSTDGFYRVVSAAPKKTLYWGGKTPSIGGSLTGGAGGYTSGSTSLTQDRF